MPTKRKARATRNIRVAFAPTGAFVAGNTTTGLTVYAHPDSQNAVRAWAMRGHKPDLVRFGATMLADLYPRDGNPLAFYEPYQARNWAILGEAWPVPLALPRAA